MNRLMVLALTSFFVLQQTDVRSEDLENAHLRAMGGKVALAKVKTLYRAGEVEGTSAYGPFQGEVEEFYDFVHQRGLSEFKVTGYRRQVGWNGDSNWVKDSLSEPRPLSAEEAVLYQYVGVPSPLLTLKAELGVERFEHGGKNEFNGIQCNTVVIQGLAMEFHLDTKTNRLVGISLADEGKVVYEDYLEMEGVPFAKKVSMELPALNTRTTVIYAQTKLNEPADDSRFKNPLEKQPKSRPEDRLVSNAEVKQLMIYLDHNKDGKISPEEATPEMRASFVHIDTNADGVVDVEEATAMLAYVKSQESANATKTAKNGKSGPQEQVTGKQILTSMDKNGDEMLSREEASEELRLYFETYDVNRDGRIDAKEAEAIAKYVNSTQTGSRDDESKLNGYSAAQIIGFLDKDGDQKINLEEASPELKAGFSYVDTNGDGVIDLEEAKVAIEQYQQ